MKAADIDISSLLEFDPAQGQLRLKGHRMLIFSQQALASLQSLCVHHFGQEYAKALFAQFGHTCGTNDYKLIGDSGDWDSDQDRIASGPVTHMWEGIVHVEPTKLEFDFDLGHFHMTGIWRNSYEAENYLQNFGPSNHPVCYALTGYASGWASAFFKKELIAIETSCIAKGDPHCAFEIKPIEVWDDRVKPWREALQASSSSISAFLEKEVASRTIDLEKTNTDLLIAKKFAEDANRTKSQFLARISHELRTPLNGVLGLGQLLLQESLPENQRVMIEQIIESGQHQLAIINDLLDFSKIEAGKMTIELHDFRFQELIEAVEESFKVQCREKGIAFVADIDGKIPEWIFADSTKIRQVLVNLLSNALKFTSSGSIVLDVKMKQDYLLFKVSDTGIGIPEEKLRELFLPFHQADNTTSRHFGGTGLGLSICRELVTLMNGRIWVESQEGRGSTFFASLPFKQGTSIQKPDLHQELEKHTSPKTADLNILIVEDNQTNYFILEQVALKLGCTVQHAINGKVATDMVNESKYDLILMDLHMPVMNGYQAIDALKDLEAQGRVSLPPVYALSADAFEETKQKCLAAGFDGFYSKPVNLKKLRDLLLKANSDRDALEKSA